MAKGVKNRMALVALALVLLLGFVMQFSYSVNASQPLGSSGFANPAVPLGYSTCSSQAEFEDILTNHPGGDVYLTSNLFLDYKSNFEGFEIPENFEHWDEEELEEEVNHTTPLTIHMGDFGITLAAQSYFSPSRPVTFVGNGIIQPLFTLEGACELEFSYPTKIIAEGISATAIFSEEDILIAQHQLLADAFQFVVNTTGANSVAVRSNGNVVVDRTQINALGENSTGIFAAGYITAYCSEINATEASLFSETGVINIDYSAVAPVPNGARSIERELYPFEPHSLLDYGFHHPLLLEDEVFDPSHLIDENSLRLKLYASAYPGTEQQLIIAADWDFSGVDFYTTGQYSVGCTPRVPASLLQKGLFQPFDVSIYIVEDSELLLYHAYTTLTVNHEPYSVSYPVRVASSPLADELETKGIRFDVSTDNGESWNDYLDSGKAEIFYDFIDLEELEEEKQYLFRLEVLEGDVWEASNILSYTHRKWFGADGEGDRDGGDRYVGAETAKPTSPPVNPPTTPETVVPDNPAKPPQSSGSSSGQTPDTSRVIINPESSTMPQLEASQGSAATPEGSIVEGIQRNGNAGSTVDIPNNLEIVIETAASQPDKASREVVAHTSLSEEEPAEENGENASLDSKVVSSEKSTSVAFWVVLKIRAKNCTK